MTRAFLTRLKLAFLALTFGLSRFAFLFFHLFFITFLLHFVTSFCCFAFLLHFFASLFSTWGMRTPCGELGSNCIRPPRHVSEEATVHIARAYEQVFVVLYIFFLNFGLHQSCHVIPGILTNHVLTFFTFLIYIPMNRTFAW